METVVRLGVTRLSPLTDLPDYSRVSEWSLDRNNKVVNHGGNSDSAPTVTRDPSTDLYRPTRM